MQRRKRHAHIDQGAVWSAGHASSIEPGVPHVALDVAWP